MQSSFTRLMAISMLLLSLPSYGEWIDASGEAQIVDGNIDRAREEAINQALNYATLQQGAMFESHQTVNQGNLTTDSYALMRGAQANNIQLVSERIQDSTILVQLRLELMDNEEQQCQLPKMKAAILVPQSQMKDRSQLRYGQLSGLEEAISERLGTRLDTLSRTSFAHIHADERLDVKQDLIDIRGYRLPNWLNETTDSQYILIPTILDMSTEPAPSSWFSTPSPNRQFQLQLSLYHGISGEEIWRKSYATAASWDFAMQETVAPNSERFWRSAYGRNIDQVMQQATRDLDSSLMCRPLLGQIVAKQHDRVIINLGRKHGINVGDKVQIVLQQNVPDRLNQMRAVATKSRATITIEQVSEESATALLVGENAALNVQINDIAIKI